MTQRSGLYFGCVQESRWKGEGVKTMGEVDHFGWGLKMRLLELDMLVAQN